jgi:hypothetical protein
VWELIGRPNSFGVREVLRKEMTTMFIHESNEENIPNRSEAYFEEVASQEEIYLEETEEELRMILVSDDSPQSRSESPNQQRDHAAEELIIGDSDDPPLSEEVVREMLRMI